MKIEIYKYLAVVIIITGCSNQKKEEPGENSFSKIKYQIVPTDTVAIEIDSLTSNFYPTFQYTEVNKHKLFSIYNHKMHRIQIYDLEKKSNLFNINLEKEGPNAIPQLSTFHLVSFDSIFIFSLDQNKILLIDSIGKTKDTFLIDEPLENNNTNYEIGLYLNSFETSFDNKSNLLTFWMAPFINKETSKYYQFPLAVDFDINKRKIERNYGYYPDSYRKENEVYFLNHNLLRIRSENYDIHYFEASHNIFLYDIISKKLIKSVYVKSEYLPDYFEPSSKGNGTNLALQEQRNFLITAGRYQRMIYDKANGLFYRFVRHPQELKAPDGLLNGKVDNKLSVMILDKDFNISGEISFPAKTFVNNTSFVSDGTLWICINHPSNIQNKEDYFQFILYKPVKI